MSLFDPEVPLSELWRRVRGNCLHPSERPPVKQPERLGAVLRRMRNEGKLPLLQGLDNASA